VLLLKPVTNDKGRNAELTTALKIDVERLFQLFEHGLTIEIKASEESAAPDETPEALQARNQIRDFGKVMQFPKMQQAVLHLSPPLPDDDGGKEEKPQPQNTKLRKKKGTTEHNLQE